MTWRLRSIVMYQRNGPGREILEFRPNQLNIISGNSQTGKSAVVDILNYGLLSKSCPIPKGFIRNAVSHIGLHLQGPKGEFQLIRDLPTAGAQTASSVWFQTGTDLKFPNQVPELKWNRDQVRDILSEFTGIPAVAALSDPKDPTPELQFAANIRHAAPLCFQPQDVIANRHVSFPGLDQETHRRHMLDALPFLLKIEDAETLRKREELRRLRAEQRRQQYLGLERARLRANAFERGHALWLACASKGLVGPEPPTDVAGLLEGLRAISLDDATRFDLATQIPNLVELEQREQKVRRELNDAKRKIRNIEDLEAAANQHQLTVDQQASRLDVATLIPGPGDDGVCPVCQNGTFHGKESADHVQQLREVLKTIRAIPLRVDHGTKRALQRLYGVRIQLEEEHQVARNRLKEASEMAAASIGQLQAGRDLDVLIGQIREYLHAVAGAAPSEPEPEKDLTAEIQRLQAEVGASESSQRKLEDSIAGRMTELAKRMEVEFAKGKAMLELSDLLIRVQVDANEDSLAPLSEIGSGANWVSYHVAAALALHEHLVNANCPVPRLLIFDQPSQAWFPRLASGTTEKNDEQGKERVPEREEDATRVAAIYQLLQDLTKDPAFSQVIVLDHAYYKEEWFTRDVLKEWRGGPKLVPPHWASDSNSTTATPKTS